MSSTRTCWRSFAADHTLIQTSGNHPITSGGALPQCGGISRGPDWSKMRQRRRWRTAIGRPGSLTMTLKDRHMTFRNGLASLLRPEDSVLVLIDHQPFQLANLNSHEPMMVVNNSAGLAKAAKAFNVPTILTSVLAAQGGVIFPQITDVFPDQEVIDRTLINTWEDPKVVDVVKST